ncbi:hypothetical protein MJN76_31505, partial [Salmonella enterica subsp. enterica serovar Anatum]|nr:hypothetical protein [Salmonella enterica subsp. enterica serovar Anatum]
TALESLLAHHDAGQLAVIAAKLNCAPDVHAIKEALALALPSVPGGALAIGVGDKVNMLQYSTYSVISPEGCASILWKSADKAPLA